MQESRTDGISSQSAAARSIAATSSRLPNAHLEPDHGQDLGTAAAAGSSGGTGRVQGHRRTKLCAARTAAPPASAPAGRHQGIRWVRHQNIGAIRRAMKGSRRSPSSHSTRAATPWALRVKRAISHAAAEMSLAATRHAGEACATVTGDHSAPGAHIRKQRERLAETDASPRGATRERSVSGSGISTAGLTAKERPKKSCSPGNILHRLTRGLRLTRWRRVWGSSTGNCSGKRNSSSVYCSGASAAAAIPHRKQPRPHRASLKRRSLNKGFSYTLRHIGHHIACSPLSKPSDCAAIVSAETILSCHHSAQFLSGAKSRQYGDR